MPLKKWKSKKTISWNIKELMITKPWKSRSKWIATLAKKQWITPKQAELKQAIAISFAKAWKTKKTSKKK